MLEHWERLRTHEDPEACAFRTAFNLANAWWRRRAVARRVEDGQQIEVRGFNIGAGTMNFAECITDLWASCSYADATAGEDGTFTATFTARRVLHWSYHGTIEESGECGVDGGCFITTWVTPKGFEPRENTFRMLIEPNGPVAIAFTPAPPPPTTTTTTTTTTTP